MRGLAAHGLVKSYRRRRVVDDVCLTIEGGEVVGLLGPNGAGKTTTFYLLVGLIHPDSGVVTLDGVDITDVPLYRRARSGIGYLPQEPSVFRGLTVEENILAVLELQSLSRRERQEKVDELLDEFGLGRHRQRLTPSFQGGAAAGRNRACLSSVSDILTARRTLRGNRSNHDRGVATTSLSSQGAGSGGVNHRPSRA